MRISQKQADLLAQEIAARIKKESGPSYVLPSVRAAIKSFKKQREYLYLEKDKIQKLIDSHEQTFSSVVGEKNVGRIRPYDTEQNIISKLEQATAPNLAVIADKIILRSMFATPETMEEFVSGLVKEFKPRATKARS